MRVFYAHPSSESPKGILEDLKRLSGLLSGRGAYDVRIVAGRQDFDANFRGNWDGWAESIVSRVHSITRKPRYDVVVIPGRCCGRVTAKIIHFALKRDRPVFTWDREASLKRVELVSITDSNDWATGFSLIAAGEGDEVIP